MPYLSDFTDRLAGDLERQGWGRLSYTYRSNDRHIYMLLLVRVMPVEPVEWKNGRKRGKGILLYRGHTV